MTNTKIRFGTLVVRKIRNLFVIGYWSENPYGYWANVLWTPLADLKSRKAARKYISSATSA